MIRPAAPILPEKELPPVEVFRLLKRVLNYTRPHPRELRRLIVAVTARAIQLSGAQFVDVSSGVESAPGVKDAVRIAAFMAATLPQVAA